MLDLDLTVSVSAMCFKHACPGHQSGCSVLCKGKLPNKTENFQPPLPQFTSTTSPDTVHFCSLEKKSSVELNMDVCWGAEMVTTSCGAAQCVTYELHRVLWGLTHPQSVPGRCQPCSWCGMPSSRCAWSVPHIWAPICFAGVPEAHWKAGCCIASAGIPGWIRGGLQSQPWS